MNAVITLLPQFQTCSEKKKGAKIQSVLPGEFLSHFARLKDPILPAQSSSSYASVVFRARRVALRCTGLLGFPMRRKRSVFSSSTGRMRTRFLSSQPRTRIIKPGWFLLKEMIKLQTNVHLLKEHYIPFSHFFFSPHTFFPSFCLSLLDWSQCMVFYPLDEVFLGAKNKALQNLLSVRAPCSLPIMYSSQFLFHGLIYFFRLS